MQHDKSDASDGLKTDESDERFLYEACVLESDKSDASTHDMSENGQSQENMSVQQAEGGQSQENLSVQQANEDPSQEGPSEISSSVSPFKNELSGEPVRALLLGALSGSSDDCAKYWWSKVTIPSDLSDDVIGVGVKRKSEFPTSQISKKRRISDDSLDISLPTSSNADSSCPSDVSQNSDEIPSNVSQILGSITDNLKGLSLCDCELVTCEFCAISGLCSLVECISVTPQDGIEVEADCDKMMPTVTPSDGGCLSLSDGSQFSQSSTWSIGRFKVVTWIKISVDVNHQDSSKPETPSQAPTGSSIFSKFKTVTLKAPTALQLKMKKPAQSKSLKKASKKRSLEQRPVQSFSAAKQLGIRAYFASQCDGPIGSEDLVNPPL